MSFNNWITFFFAACLIAISPGSGAVLSMSHGLSFGVRKASATILGLQAGLLLVLLLAGAGVGSLLVASELAFGIIKTVGALYLVYIGIAQWRAKIDSGPSIEAQSQSMPNVPDFGKRFFIGFFTNATNPKSILFMVAVLPQFINDNTALLPQLSTMAATMCTIDLFVMHGYAFAASSMQRFFREARAIKMQNRIFGGMLVAVGAALLFVKRSPAS